MFKQPLSLPLTWPLSQLAPSSTWPTGPQSRAHTSSCNIDCVWVQILSRLYHLYPSRAAKSIPIVKSTAIRSKSPQIYELLGELQAETDPAGDLCLLLKHRNLRTPSHSACSMGTACRSVGLLCLAALKAPAIIFSPPHDAAATCLQCRCKMMVCTSACTDPAGQLVCWQLLVMLTLAAAAGMPACGAPVSLLSLRRVVHSMVQK